MADDEGLIPKHGGYRHLKSFQIAQLAYDVTVRFCDRYIDRFSRTRDQMVQAARSGVQNIAEGSQASGTSKKTELKLTNVARASLEELRLDYEDYLRQRGLPKLEHDHPALKRFKAKRCAKIEDVRDWVVEERGVWKKHTDEHGLGERHTDEHGLTRTHSGEHENLTESVSVSDSPGQSLSDSTLVANAALSLLNLSGTSSTASLPHRRQPLKRKGASPSASTAPEAMPGENDDRFPLQRNAEPLPSTAH